MYKPRRTLSHATNYMPFILERGLIEKHSVPLNPPLVKSTVVTGELEFYAAMIVF